MGHKEPCHQSPGGLRVGRPDTERERKTDEKF
jgi:hypothetical protein